MVKTTALLPRAGCTRAELEDNLSDTFTERLIRRKARQLVHRVGYTKSDQPDIEQELRLHLWKKAARFDPTRSHWNAFATIVVERHVARLIEKGRTQKRGRCLNIVSLQTLVEDADGLVVRLDQMIGADEQAARTGQHPVADARDVDLRDDVSAVLDSLTPELRNVCAQLMRESQTAVAERLGIPRSTLRYWLRVVRERFIAAGFDEFLPEAPPEESKSR